MSRNPDFAQKEVHLANFAKAIAHPARVAILKELAQRKSCICGEIVEVLPLAQATVSQHLKELKALGLISGTVEGVKSCYCVNWEVFEQMTGDFLCFFKEVIAQKPEDGLCC